MCPGVVELTKSKAERKDPEGSSNSWRSTVASESSWRDQVLPIEFISWLGVVKLVRLGLSPRLGMDDCIFLDLFQDLTVLPLSVVGDVDIGAHVMTS